jgi:tetratricopeptide (TPR) repeat protein
MKIKSTMSNIIKINPQRQKLIVYIVLILVTLAVFWQMTQSDFINFDDHVYVTQNSHIQYGITLEGFRWAFNTTYAEFWHPLTWLSLMLDSQLYGLNAGGYHLTNLILHIMSTLLLFWLFNRMTGAIWRSAFIAALFALHPLHVESVAWISERKDVLSAFFWMLTLCLYVYYTEKPVIKRYLPVLFSFVCGLMSKPMVVTLPIVMILLDYWPLKRFESNKNNLVLWQLREKISFIIFSAVFAIITFNAKYKSSAEYLTFPFSSRIANAPVSFVTYLEKTFWPNNLSIFYPFPNQIPAWQTWGAFLLILLISSAVLALKKRLPYLFTGWLWYAITILPVIGIVQIGYYSMADRHTYLPLIGIGIMLAWGIPLLLSPENIRKKILFPSGIAFLTIIAVLSWHQCGYWKNSIRLFSHASHVTKDNYLAHSNLASAMLDEGKFDDAINHYDEAISIISHSAGVYSNSENTPKRIVRHQNSSEDDNEGILLRFNLAEAYNKRGKAYAKSSQYQYAINDFNEAIRLQPDEISFYNNRGNSYAELGQYQRAFEDFNTAIRLQPDYAAAYYNRGTAYVKLGQHQRAIEDFNEAIRLKPDYADAYCIRGAAYFLQGNNDLGCRDEQKACALGNCKLLEMAQSKGACH